jgi:hypothetical protein
MAKPIQQASDLLKKCQQEINDLLKGPEYINNLVGINQHFERIKARLIHSGAVIEHDVKQTDAKQFPPIKNFMGEKIEVSEKNKTADLRPDEAQRREFVSKVDKLYNEIEAINPHTILNSYTTQNDILVLRGVAKKADVVDFKEAEINLAFVEDIQKAVKIKKENAGTQQKIDQNSKSTKSILTQEVIDKDPELQKRNAQPGDELEVFPDGKMKVHKAK